MCISISVIILSQAAQLVKMENLTNFILYGILCAISAAVRKVWRTYAASTAATKKAKGKETEKCWRN